MEIVSMNGFDARKQDAITYVGGVVGGVGDGLRLTIGDRVGHIGEGENARLSGCDGSESAENDGLGEHFCG